MEHPVSLQPFRAVSGGGFHGAPLNAMTTTTTTHRRQLSHSQPWTMLGPLSAQALQQQPVYAHPTSPAPSPQRITLSRGGDAGAAPTTSPHSTPHSLSGPGWQPPGLGLGLGGGLLSATSVLPGPGLVGAASALAFSPFPALPSGRGAAALPSLFDGLPSWPGQHSCTTGTSPSGVGAGIGFHRPGSASGPGIASVSGTASGAYGSSVVAASSSSHETGSSGSLWHGHAGSSPLTLIRPSSASSSSSSSSGRWQPVGSVVPAAASFSAPLAPRTQSVTPEQAARLQLLAHAHALKRQQLQLQHPPFPTAGGHRQLAPVGALTPGGHVLSSSASAASGVTGPHPAVIATAAPHFLSVQPLALRLHRALSHASEPAGATGGSNLTSARSAASGVGAWCADEAVPVDVLPPPRHSSGASDQRPMSGSTNSSGATTVEAYAHDERVGVGPSQPSFSGTTTTDPQSWLRQQRERETTRDDMTSRLNDELQEEKVLENHSSHKDSDGSTLSKQQHPSSRAASDPKPNQKHSLLSAFEPEGDLRSFIMSPAPNERGLVQCTIVRDRTSSLSHRIHPVYSLYLRKRGAAMHSAITSSDLGAFLLAGRKRPHNKTSNYVVSIDKDDINRDKPSFVGKLRSNFIGTEFSIFDNGEGPKGKDSHAPSSPNASSGASKQGSVSSSVQRRKELGIVCYASNVLGSRGPRKMKVALPKITSDGSRVTFKHLSERITTEKKTATNTADDESMLSAFRNGYTQDMILLINKPPKWNESVGAFVLNFGGRVTQASVKNFQLVSADDHDTVLLQFGRCGKDVFTMDFGWPLCAYQAFAICLSSFDFKLACE